MLALDTKSLVGLFYRPLCSDSTLSLIILIISFHYYSSSYYKHIVYNCSHKFL